MRRNLAINLAIPWWIPLILLLLLILTVAANAKQMQPDVKRVKQIQAALGEHGYQSGKTWVQTQEILRGIAQDHGWQTRRVPDARVLILLDLGNQHSDPAVALEGSNYLDYKKAPDPEEDK